MREYKASCYALRRAVKCRQTSLQERIESHFQLNDSRRMWQGLRTICAFGNKSSAEVRTDPSLAEELNTFYAAWKQRRHRGSAEQHVRKQQAERSENHVITVSEDEVRRALKSSQVKVELYCHSAACGDIQWNEMSCLTGPRCYINTDIQHYKPIHKLTYWQIWLGYYI